MYLVTFRNLDEKLTSMFAESYRSAKDAKCAIETDAKAFMHAHDRAPHGIANAIGKELCRKRTYSSWMDTKNTDYFKAVGRDGSSCIWQYFKA